MDEKHSLVSVILPCYNREKTIAASIQSVLDQDYRDFELIVIDDGSTDNTAAIVRKFEDSRIRLIENDHNIGAAASRNAGILEAGGEYLAFQDSDDFWEVGKISAQLKILTDNPEADVCVCSYTFDKNGKLSVVSFPFSSPSNSSLLRFLEFGGAIGTQLLFARTNVIREIGGFDESLPRRQDFDLCLRLGRSRKFVFSDLLLVRVVHTRGSISDNPGAFELATKTIIKKHIEHSANPAYFQATQYAKCSRNYRVSGRLDKSDEFAIKSLAEKLTAKGLKEYLASKIYKYLK